MINGIMKLFYTEVVKNKMSKLPNGQYEVNDQFKKVQGISIKIDKVLFLVFKILIALVVLFVASKINIYFGIGMCLVEISYLFYKKSLKTKVEFEIENKYREVLQKYFNYDDIHFTFIGLNSFDTVFADIYIDYKDKLIFNIDLHYDYLMYISKFNRVNENLIKLVREDWESKYGIL